MYGKGSDLLAAANGEQEADALADKRAKKALAKGCTGLNCLFTSADKAESSDGLGTGSALTGAMKQLHLGGGDARGGMTAGDFGKAKTSTHTGMHYSYRLDHLSMTHGGKAIPKTHSENGVNVPGQVRARWLLARASACAPGRACERCGVRAVCESWVRIEWDRSEGAAPED